MSWNQFFPSGISLILLVCRQPSQSYVFYSLSCHWIVRLSVTLLFAHVSVILYWRVQFLCSTYDSYRFLWKIFPGLPDSLNQYWVFLSFQKVLIREWKISLFADTRCFEINNVNAEYDGKYVALLKFLFFHKNTGENFGWIFYTLGPSCTYGLVGVFHLLPHWQELM